MNLRHQLKSAWEQRGVRLAVWGLLAISLIYIIGFVVGKRKGKGDQTTYPTGQTVPDTWVKDIAPGLINMLHDALAGWGFSLPPKKKALEQLFVLTDTQLVYVSNEYNHQYFNNSSDTLLKLIETEHVGWSWEPNNGVEAQQKIVARMRGLDIR